MLPEPKQSTGSLKRGRYRRVRFTATVLGLVLFGIGAFGAVHTFSQDSASEMRRTAADQLNQATALHPKVRITHDAVTGVFHAIINGKNFKSKQFGEIERAAQKIYPGQIVEFIDTRTEKLLYTMPRTMLGVILDPIAGLAASQLQIPEGRGLVLEKVFRGMPAAQANLQEYDIILSCNGQSGITKAAFTEILIDANPGDHLNLVILRGGQEMELQVKLQPYDPILSRRLGNQKAAGSAGHTAALGVLPNELVDENLIFEITGANTQFPTKLRRLTPNYLGTVELIQENERIHRELKMVSVKLNRLEELLKILLVERFGEHEVSRRLEALPEENVDFERKGGR